MALSRLEDFDPNYRNRLGGDIRSFEVYSNSNTPVGRVADAWVDDIGNIQQLVVDLNSAPPGNRIMVPMAQAQLDRTKKRVYVSDLPSLQAEATHRSQPGSYAPPQSTPGYRVASLEESAPLERYRSPEPMPPASHRVSRQVDLPPIPPETYDDHPQRIDYTKNAPVPPVDARRETYSQNSTPHSPVPPLDVRNADRPPMPREYEREQPPYSEQGIHDRAPEYPRVVDEETIPVLEERLVVENHVRKTGEVVVRKEIETEIVEVPVRREKLIVEQEGAEPRQLAEIDLHQDIMDDSEIIDRAHEHRHTRKRLD